LQYVAEVFKAVLSVCLGTDASVVRGVVWPQVTSYSLAMANAAEAVAGPTAGDAGALGVFKWDGQWTGVAHRGQPEAFDFAFEMQKP
jgi:hypothetical protein